MANREQLSMAHVVYGATLVALHGLEQEEILAARKAGLEDWSQWSAYARVHELLKRLRRGERGIVAPDERISDLMAHTRQTFRISADEWDQHAPVRTYVEPTQT